MMTVTEARAIIAQTIHPGPVITVPLQQCVGKILAHEVRTLHDFPLFAASAMDGYAIRSDDTQHATPAQPCSLRVTDILYAGDHATHALNSGETIRIMTGAMIPPGASAVVPQEDVAHATATQILLTHTAAAGEHIRKSGEECRRGNIVASAGDPLTPARIGYLAALGIYEVPVCSAPRVAIIPTGSELIRDPAALTPGKIFESNSFALGAAITALGITPTVYPPIPDEERALRHVLQDAIATHDITIVSGGVSVGDKDYVRAVLDTVQVESLFWSVAQKPGKPFYCGKRAQRVVFGLPGNPASSLVCFYEYVQPAILRWLGHTAMWPAASSARLQQRVTKKNGRTHFLRAIATYTDGTLFVTPLSSQDSHRMASFARANCLLIVPEETQALALGAHVDIHWIGEKICM